MPPMEYVENCPLIDLRKMWKFIDNGGIQIEFYYNEE